MDSVHLNYNGNKVIAEKIYQKILPIILKNDIIIENDLVKK